MTEENNESKEIHILKLLWPIFMLAGFFSIGIGGIFILIVPLSFIFWPDEPFHAFEMGLLITSILWGLALSGIIKSRFVDNHKVNRVKILFIFTFFRGICMIMLSFAQEGKGFEAWLYFYLIAVLLSVIGGGKYNNIFSLSHDIVPSSQRSRFFGLYAIFRSIFMLLGFILSGLLVQLGYWKLFFISNGLALIIFATIVLLKVKEPKRGVQREELMHVLQDEKIKYDFNDRKMRRKTMLSKTNLVALIEGIFTSVFLGSLIILVLPYIQTAPHNFSPLSTGIFLAVFGLTGGLIGQLLLARVSDRVSSGDKIVNRLYFIIAALTVGGISFVLMFFIPLPHLTVEEGENVLYLFSFPIIWIFGFIRVISRSISSLYEINQPPILQEINLPETQGRIIAWNRFLESIAFGSGAVISGILIIWTGYNYQLVAIIISAIAIPGILLWVLALKYFEEDRQFIREILKERAQILKSRNSK